MQSSFVSAYLSSPDDWIGKFPACDWVLAIAFSNGLDVRWHLKTADTNYSNTTCKFLSNFRNIIWHGIWSLEMSIHYSYMFWILHVITTFCVNILRSLWQFCFLPSTYVCLSVLEVGFFTCFWRWIWNWTAMLIIAYLFASHCWHCAV